VCLLQLQTSLSSCSSRFLQHWLMIMETTSLILYWCINISMLMLSLTSAFSVSIKLFLLILYFFRRERVEAHVLCQCMVGKDYGEILPFTIKYKIWEVIYHIKDLNFLQLNVIPLFFKTPGFKLQLNNLQCSLEFREIKQYLYSQPLL
jgi:hypothetical protein